MLENVRIVDNKVHLRRPMGLLDRKSNLSALEMESMLSPESGESSFQLVRRSVRFQYRGHHFFLRLAQPKALNLNQRAISLQKNEHEVLRAVEMKCALSQIRKGSYAVEPSLTLEVKSVSFYCPESSHDESEENIVPWSWPLEDELPDFNK